MDPTTTRSRSLKVTVDADCGNAPKKEQVRDWVIDLARGNVKEVCESLSDDVTWEEAGSDTTSGTESVRSRITELARSEVSAIEVRHLLSHGKQVVVEGTLTCDGSDERFVHIITFSGHGKGAMISEVLTYRA